MFRIHDNPDGTTSIYDKISGNRLCTIPGKVNSTCPRKVNVVGPQPSNVAQSSSGTDWRYLKKQKSCAMSDEPAPLKDQNIVLPITRESKCCISPIPICLDGNQTEDYFNDSVTQDEFAKCLGLISKERFRAEDREIVLEYPLRLLSRSKAYRTSEGLLDMKIPDFIPLTSYFGVRLLRLNESKNFINDEKAMISLRAYDSFCRHPYNTANPTSCHFPKLRCRETKQYPINTATKVLRLQTNHYYSYGRRQRMERKITLRTGLDAQSRRLLLRCNAKRCTVVLKRLSEKEIKLWLSRRSLFYPPHPPPIPKLDREDPPYVPTSSFRFPKRPLRSLTEVRPRRKSLLRSIMQSSNLRGVSTQQKLLCNKKCVVDLRNVINDIQRQGGSHYLRNTRIRIPFYRDFLSSLKSKRSSLNAIYVMNGIKSDTSSGEDIDCYSSIPKKLTEVNSSSTIEGVWHTRDSNGSSKNLFRPSQSGQKKASSKLRSSKLNFQNRSLSAPIQLENSKRPEPIPVIDLTEETTPPKETATVKKRNMPFVSERFIVSQWKFQCFGCGFHRFYFSNNYQSHSVETAVREHMQVYHSVNNAESFLSRYLDSVNHCTVIEAFPGFKGSFDD